jgi:hypothetical protein
LRDKTERQLAPLREQFSARHKELFALWSAEPPNRTAILQKESEVAGLRQKIRQLLTEQRLSFLALLTPPQRASWRAQHTDGRMGAPRMGCGCMQGGNDIRARGNNPRGGMGNDMHGGMRAGGMPMGMDECLDCLDCMNCDATGRCAPSSPSPPAPGTSSATQPR